MINISFVTHKSKIDENNYVPIFMRLTLNGRRTEISMKKKVLLASWNKPSQSIKRSDKYFKITNDFLLLKKSEALNCYNLMLSGNEKFDVLDVRRRILGETNDKTLMYAVDFHNEQMKSLVGSDYAIGTYKRYVVTRKKVKAFIKAEYKSDDILICRVDSVFMECFLHYLKTNDKQMISTATKYVKNLKKILKLAYKYKWMKKVPEINLSLNGQKRNIKYLTAEELKSMEAKHFTIERLEKVRDIFLFCCYTGLAYSDVEKITMDNLVNTIEGSKAIEVYRTKTKNRCYIPLMPQAIAIIDKYSDSDEQKISQKLLPVNSNQRTNAYLKEIADLCGIKKKLTHHYARFTFATTVTLANDIPITDVAYMMGHTNLRTTQIYASVVDKNVTRSMASLGDKMSSKIQQNVKNENLQSKIS